MKPANMAMFRVMEDDSFSTADWRRLLAHLGENPDRQGLVDTPQRVEKAWKQWTSGYDKNPADILKVFEDGAEQYNELIVVRGIPVYSHCEHHLAPFFGTATVGYTPNGKIVGLSKLTRLVDCFAKRLQVQERLTMQIAEALMTHVEPLSIGVVIRCRHMCIESRGIQTSGEETVTSALLGEMRTNPGLKSEFLALAREKTNRPRANPGSAASGISAAAVPPTRNPATSADSLSHILRMVLNSGR